MITPNRASCNNLMSVYSKYDKVCWITVLQKQATKYDLIL